MIVLVVLIIYLLAFILLGTIPTLLMSFFVLKPIAKAKESDLIKQKKLFWKMFWIRIGILAFLSIFMFFTIWLFDVILFFIMLFFVVPKIRIENVSTNTPVVNSDTSVSQLQNVNETQVSQNVVQEKRIPVLPSSFDNMYSYNENKLVEVFINKELEKVKINKYNGLIPMDALKRKKIINIIILFLLFVLISMIFFHFPIYSYVIGVLIILIVYKTSRKFDLTMYLKKELKARPSEKVSNIIMNVKNTLVKDDSNKIFAIGIIIAIALPLLIFIKPRIIYEKMDNGYGVRFYAFGLTNFTSATIPETYKGEKVVSLRGNTFSNMFFLKEINLPDTITEIRGQAFKNLLFLEEIKLPSKLEYLGGGAFYNCKKLKSIEIPDSVTELGGESFYGASSLESVKLSKNITEIRGNTFENCKSLKSITIPDKVTRIGGHAFYANSSLSEVLIGENSQLVEIGSSAFRLCDSLNYIVLPTITSVNSRAFKESPTEIVRFSYDNGELTNYKYNTARTFWVGSSATIYGTSRYILTLDNIHSDGIDVYYNLTLSGDKNMKIELNNTDNMKFKVDDDLLIEVVSFYKDEDVRLEIYYN